MKVKTKDLPSQAELRQLFVYNFEAGELTNRVLRNYRPAGSRAGSVGNRGYRRVGIGGEIYAEHRLIWVWVYGEIPHGYLIDHINHNKSDNRIQNLRLVTHQENNLNISLNRVNKTNYRGVTQTRHGKYKASIKHQGRNKYLGTFSTALEAFNCYSQERAKAYSPSTNKNNKKDLHE